MKFAKTAFVLTIFVVIFYVGYKNNYLRLIIDTWQNAWNAAVDQPQASSPQKHPEVNAKEQVDLFIQQQYLKTLSEQQTELADDLSDSEKLQLLEKALHEFDSASDEYDREQAIMTLGELTGAEAKQGVINGLHDESGIVVSQAIRQINKWQNTSERTDMLLIALQSFNDDIVEQTLLAITVVEDKKLIARLKQLSKHENPNIREAAKLALNLAP